jgi:hypothetical protein
MCERPLLVGFLFGWSFLAGQGQPAPATEALLGRIRAHMGDVLHHVPNYTCIETMERTRRIGPARQFQMQDTLRLEVALVEGREMFAWPGSKKFESDDLRSLISTGAYGNGTFALFAQSVFNSSAPVFTYRGEEPVKGRNAVRWDFKVAQQVSSYQIHVQGREAVVGYRGSFWADPVTLDALRLEVVAEEIPPFLKLSFASDRVDYARARIGDEDFLLPTESELNIKHPGGDENRNYVRFTGCRQYSGESVLRFDEALSDDPGAKPPEEEILLPEGLDLLIALADDIDPKKAAAGDPLHATLDFDLKKKGKIVVSKGAVVLGRITRVERYPEFTAIGMTFTDVYTKGKHAGLNVEFDRLASPPMLTPMLWNPPPNQLVPALPTMPHEGVLRLRAGHYLIRRGILMYWRT